jgi:hypothetical protein
MPQDHKKLDIYGKAFEFSKDVYKVTAHFPKEEVYGVTNQLRRASSSIGANIAEGAGSQTNNHPSVPRRLIQIFLYWRIILLL